MENEQYWYFTFGIGHLLNGYIIQIKGSFEEARALMVEQFECHWCGQYNEEIGKELIEKYDYKVIEV